MSGGTGDKSDSAPRVPSGDEALREVFAELRHSEEAMAPPLVRLLAPAPRRRGSAGRIGGVFPHAAARRWAAATAVLVVAGLGLWLGDGGRGRRPFGAREAPALSSWVAPTDFLLDTPGIELLRSTPEIPGPLPSTGTAAITDLATGDHQ